MQESAIGMLAEAKLEKDSQIKAMNRKRQEL